jgi:hypothetical protein
VRKKGKGKDLWLFRGFEGFYRGFGNFRGFLEFLKKIW